MTQPEGFDIIGVITKKSPLNYEPVITSQSFRFWATFALVESSCLSSLAPICGSLCNLYRPSQHTVLTNPVACISTARTKISTRKRAKQLSLLLSSHRRNDY